MLGKAGHLLHFFTRHQVTVSCNLIRLSVAAVRLHHLLGNLASPPHGTRPDARCHLLKFKVFGLPCIAGKCSGLVRPVFALIDGLALRKGIARGLVGCRKYGIAN